MGVSKRLMSLMIAKASYSSSFCGIFAMTKPRCLSLSFLSSFLITLSFLILFLLSIYGLWIKSVAVATILFDSFFKPIYCSLLQASLSHEGPCCFFQSLYTFISFSPTFFFKLLLSWVLFQVSVFFLLFDSSSFSPSSLSSLLPLASSHPSYPGESSLISQFEWDSSLHALLLTFHFFLSFSSICADPSGLYLQIPMYFNPSFPAFNPSTRLLYLHPDLLLLVSSSRLFRKTYTNTICSQSLCGNAAGVHAEPWTGCSLLAYKEFNSEVLCSQLFICKTVCPKSVRRKHIFTFLLHVNHVSSTRYGWKQKVGEDVTPTEEVKRRKKRQEKCVGKPSPGSGPVKTFVLSTFESSQSTVL